MSNLALTPQWSNELTLQASSDFILLPAEAQERGYDYNWVAKQYLSFLKDGTRKQKLKVARKFFKFLKQINRDRAKQELGEDFFEALDFYWNNFNDLNSRQDWIALEAIDIISEMCSRFNFVIDIVSSEELKKKVEKLDILREKEDVIDLEYTVVEDEYRRLNANPTININNS